MVGYFKSVKKMEKIKVKTFTKILSCLLLKGNLVLPILGRILFSFLALFLFYLGSTGASLFSQTISSFGNKKFLTIPFQNKVFIEEQGQFKKIVEENKTTVPGTILFAINRCLYL